MRPNVGRRRLWPLCETASEGQSGAAKAGAT
jgi:hypothetical protein